MSYPYFILCLAITTILSLVWVLIEKKETPVFTKRTNRALLFGSLIFALLGASGLLVKKPLAWNVAILVWLFQLLFLGIGFLHFRLLQGYYTWYDGKSLRLVIPFSIFVFAICGMSFFTIFWLVEIPFFKISTGIADNLVMELLVAFVPLSVFVAHQFWNMIPVIREELKMWKLDLSKEAPLIEPSSRAKRLSLNIPLNNRNKELVKYDIRANLNNTLGDLFHHLLHKHNIQKRSPKPIEFAEDNQRDKMYSWLFYQKGKKWWWETKDYLDPNTQVRYLSFQDGKEIYIERNKNW